MCEIMEELNRKAAKEAAEKAAKEAAKKATERTRKHNALEMLKTGKLSLEDISVCSGLDIEEVKKLAKSKLS